MNTWSLWHLLRYGSGTHDLHYGRDPRGRMTQTCVLCGYTRPVLAEAAITGPAHQAQPDLGAVKTKAQRESPFDRQRRVG